METKKDKRRQPNKNILFKKIEYNTKLTKKDISFFIGFNSNYYNKVSANPLKFLKAEQFIKLFFLAKVDFIEGIYLLFPLSSFNDQARAKWYEENPGKGASQEYILTPRAELRKQSELLEEINKLTAVIYKLKKGKHRVNIPRDFNPYLD